MHFLKYIRLNNYLNLKHAKLEGLKDLNIIIGPNNCGKTSVLRGISLLQKIRFGKYPPSIDCKDCREGYDKSANILAISGELDEREGYLGKPKAKIVFRFDIDEIEKSFPNIIEKRDNILNEDDVFALIESDKAEDSEMYELFNASIKHRKSEFAKANIILKEKTNRKLVPEHISFLIDKEFRRKILQHILLCPDARLQNYKGVSIPEHIRAKNLSTTENSRLIGFLRDFVDPNLTDIRQNLELIRDMEGNRFDTAIAEQGSGVKSLICLVADILSEKQTKILLIDEPELGLNPSGKHAFLKFLLEQTKNKQIFLATHDPTFVNPVLSNRENVSVYLFSIINNEFVKVDLAQSKQDPNTFAGFLPHTTSLKQVHIYVEGTYDVYIFQMFLDKYVKKRFKEDWHRILNKIGIFHLGGDFWSHLLYTIPKSPYSSIVILDGDKEEIAKQVVSKYATIEKDRFQVFDSLDELKNEKKQKKPIIPTPCPVYCLKRPKIEEYLETRLGTMPISKEEGPAIAYEMKDVPTEIEVLFDAIFQMAGVLG